MDRQKQEHYKQRLLEEKAEISHIIDGLRDKGVDNTISYDTSELSVYDNHPGDIGSEVFEVEKNRALKANEAVHLKLVNEALDHIEKGTYGKCEICRKDIDEERLEVIPYANSCIECEKNRKPDHTTYWQDRPVEETVIGYPFGSTNRDAEDYTGYDGEDTWQELESYNPVNYHLWDEEDEGMQGVVEDIDRISNEQYRKQLPD